jgi:hypothetical protein
MVKLYLDADTEMAMVTCRSDKLVMLGNFWDFHPGCHGIYEYGDFSSAKELATKVALKETRRPDYIIVEGWNYEQWINHATK